MDTNARVVTRHTSAIGPEGFSEEEHCAGIFFHEFLGDSSLRLPSTPIEQQHPQHTRTSPSSSRQCIDYIAIPCEWSGAVQDVGVFTDFDSLGHGVDHRLATVKLEVKLQATATLRPAQADLNDPKL